MESRINNLVYVGQNTFPGPGVPPVMISGINGARILDKKMIKQFDSSFILFNKFTLIFFIITLHFLIYDYIF